MGLTAATGAGPRLAWTVLGLSLLGSVVSGVLMSYANVWSASLVALVPGIAGLLGSYVGIVVLAIALLRSNHGNARIAGTILIAGLVVTFAGYVLGQPALVAAGQIALPSGLAFFGLRTTRAGSVGSAPTR